MSNTKNGKIAIKSIVTAAVLGASLGATAGAANAYGKKSIDNTAAAEAAAIEKGRYSGELTRREYRDLKSEQDSIKSMERRALADGHVSKREYNAIHEAQHNAARHIKDESTDGQKSWYRRWLYNHRN